MILKGFFPFLSSKCINYLQCKLSTNYSSYFISTKLINEDFQRRGFVLCNLRKLLISDFKIKNLDYWKYYVQYIKEKDVTISFLSVVHIYPVPLSVSGGGYDVFFNL